MKKKRNYENSSFPIGNEKKLKKFISELFTGASQYMVRTTDKEEIMECDFYGSALNRRIEAAIRSVTRIEEHLKGTALDFEWASEAIIKHECWGHPGFDRIDEIDSILLGAALWILESLKKNGNLYKLYELLPKNIDDLERVDGPMEIYHPCFEYDLIYSVMYVIQMRNSELPMRNDEKYRIFVNSRIAENRKPEKETQSRSNYDRMIALLDPERIAEAEKYFEDKQWDFCERYVKCLDIYKRQLQRVQQDIKVLDSMGMPVSNALLMNPLERMMPDLGEQLMNLIEEEEGLKNGIHQFLYYAIYMPQMTKAESLEKCQRWDVIRQMKQFTIEHPLDICFALLHLLDSGSDLPWLYNTSQAVVRTATSCLPWYYAHDEEDERDYEWFYEQSNPAADEETAEEWKKAEKDLYELRYDGGTRNLAQIYYHLTNSVLPIGFHSLSGRQTELKEMGVKDEEIKIILDKAEILYQHVFQSRARNLGFGLESLFSELEIKDTSEAENENENDESSDADAVCQKLQKENERLKKELGRMKETLYKVNRAAQEAELKYEKEKQSAEREHRELADLKEILFKFDDYIQAPDKEDDAGIVFPQELNSRFVVFGGHATFLKAIRPLLPGVRFIEPESQVNTDLIKNADMVWLQTNCMSHSQYNRVVSLVKKYDKPLRYLTSASAVKCACQMVMEERDI